MHEDGDAIWGLLGLLVGLVLAALVLFALVAPVAGHVLMWGLPLLVGLGGCLLGLAAFLTTRGDEDSKTRTRLAQDIRDKRVGGWRP